jgi:hypothetical protein
MNFELKYNENYHIINICTKIEEEYDAYVVMRTDITEKIIMPLVS